MWNWLNCYLSGRHDFGVSCEPGAIFLRCIHCGKRSNGWDLNARQAPLKPVAAHLPATVHLQPAVAPAARTLPFTQRGVVRHQRSA
jgi:hypothetical protein